MIALKNVAASTLGKNFLIAIGGLAWVFFLITHMLANLQLLLPSGDSYNRYSYSLVSWGWVLIVAEVGLVFMLVMHAGLAIKMTLLKRKARGSERYTMMKTKGGLSYSTPSSRNMIVTGVIILGFLIFHVYSFKYGPAENEGYTTVVNGVEMRDLYRLVTERFHEPLYVSFYVAVMILLGLHLRHGFWSAFQSLGAMTPRLSKPIHLLGVLVAFTLVLGFVIAPLWIYFDMAAKLGSGGSV